MKKYHIPLAFALLISWAGAAQDALHGADLRRFLAQHCYDCHADGMSKGGLDLETLGTDLRDGEIMRRWVLLHDRVAAGEMPPKEGKLSDEERNEFVARLGGVLHKTDAAQREVVLRRLNRVEYEYTLRDLFQMPRLQVKDMLPEDPKAFGFDTIGEALVLSAEQMITYLEAADHVLDTVLEPGERPEFRTRKSNLKDSNERALGTLFREMPEGVVLFSSAYSPAIFRSFDIREPGLYRFKLLTRTFQSDTAMTVRVYAGDVITSRRARWLDGFYEVAHGDDWTVLEFETWLDNRDSLRVRTYRNGGHEKNAATVQRPGILVGDAICEGPIIGTWPPAGYVALLGGVDLETADAADAEKVLRRFLPRAFRRELRPGEVEPYMRLVRAALAQERPWMDALRQGLKAVLVSPEFLFLEEDAAEVGDFALASRLSYFLWRSMPDETLFDLAARGALGEGDTLREQAERMLADPKAARFVDDFTGQWLKLREIDFTEPDERLFPEYDDVLRAAMLAESRGFFREILEKDLGVGEFVGADWTILNSRLAEHYGVPGVEGLEYRRVKLPEGNPRGGVLTQAAVLKVTANGTNTSPVMRGVWVLENILGETPSPPPPGVGAIEPDITGATTIREMLEMHRADPTCARCHEDIDPPGFALERFDPVGGWRDWYRSMGGGERLRDRFVVSAYKPQNVRYKRGQDVDASGVTPEGNAFRDFSEFKALLAADEERIARTLAEKLLAFGLGRGTGISDRPLLDGIVARCAEQGYGFRSLIKGIVLSEAFAKP